MDPNTFTQKPYSQSSVTGTDAFTYLFNLYCAYKAYEGLLACQLKQLSSSTMPTESSQITEQQYRQTY